MSDQFEMYWYGRGDRKFSLEWHEGEDMDAAMQRAKFSKVFRIGPDASESHMTIEIWERHEDGICLLEVGDVNGFQIFAVQPFWAALDVAARWAPMVQAANLCGWLIGDVALDLETIIQAHPAVERKREAIRRAAYDRGHAAGLKAGRASPAHSPA